MALGTEQDVRRDTRRIPISDTVGLLRSYGIHEILNEIVVTVRQSMLARATANIINDSW